jgi:hypothetical protein
MSRDAVIAGHNEVFDLCPADKAAELHNLCSSSRPDSSSLSSIAAAIHVVLGPKVLEEESFVMATVRNPYDRCVSSWMYTASWWCSFPEFVELLASRGLDSAEWNWHQRTHLCPQKPHLLDASGALAVDFVGRVEHLDDDIAAALDLLQLPNHDLAHDNRQEYEQADFRDYYTSEHLRDLVYSVYKDDIHFLGYTFSGE